MDDTSILTNNQLKENKSVDNNAVGVEDYLNLLIREVCICGDSLEKYEHLLKKMFPEDCIYERCLGFVSFFNGVKQRGHCERHDKELLHGMGKSLFLTDETMMVIDSELDKLSINPLTLEKEKHQSENPKPLPEDRRSVGLIMLSLVIPFLGWVLYYALRKKTPVRAKACSYAAWVCIAINVIIRVI